MGTYSLWTIIFVVAAIITLAGAIAFAVRIKKAGDGKTGESANISLRRSKVAAVILLIATAVFIVLACCTTCSKTTEEQQASNEETTEATEQQQASVASSEGQTSIKNSSEEVTPVPPTPTSKYTYAVTFDGNATDVTNVPDPISFTSEATSYTIQIPGEDSDYPARNEKAFIGWIETKTYTAGQPIHYAGDAITLTSANPQITLYALWKTAVATIDTDTGTMVFDLEDANAVSYASNEINKYIVNDQTHINPSYKTPSFLDSVMAYFLDLAYAADVYPEWHGNASAVKTVTFTDNFNIWHPRSTSGWFYDCENLSNFYGANLNTINCRNMTFLFGNCKSYNTIDISTWVTSAVTQMKGMFVNCYHIANIYVDEAKWDTSNVLSSAGGDNGQDMFYNDFKLPGFDNNKCDVSMATLDKYLATVPSPDPFANKYRFQVLFNPGVAPDGTVLTYKDVEGMPEDHVFASANVTGQFRLSEFIRNVYYYGAVLDGWKDSAGNVKHIGDFVYFDASIGNYTGQLTAVWSNVMTEVKGTVAPDYAAGQDYSGFKVETILPEGEPTIPSTVTTENGKFSIPNVPQKFHDQPRNITFKISKTGYETKEITISSALLTPGTPYDLGTIAPAATKIVVSGNVLPNAWDTDDTSKKFQDFEGTFTADDESEVSWEAGTTYNTISGQYSIELPYSFTGKLTVSKTGYVTKEYTLTNLTTATTQNVDILAKTYKVRFNVNRPEISKENTTVVGATEDPRTTESINSYAKYTLDANPWSIYAKANNQAAYSFLGWSLTSGQGQDVEFDNNETIKRIAENDGEIIDVYGQWDGLQRNINVYYFEYDGINHVTDPTKGISVKESEIVQKKYYENYSIDAPEISGYTCITTSPVTGITPNYDLNVIFEYQQDAVEVSGEVVNETGFSYDLSGFSVTFQGTKTSPTGESIQKTYTTTTYKDENNKYVYKFANKLDYGLKGTLTVQSIDNSFAVSSKSDISIVEGVTIDNIVMTKLRRTLSGSLTSSGIISGATIKLSATNGVWSITDKELTLEEDGTFKYNEDGGLHYGSTYTLSVTKTGYRTITYEETNPVTINQQLTNLNLAPIEYTISYNETLGTATPYTQKVTYDSHPNLTKNKFSAHTGYTFKDWVYGDKHFTDQQKLTEDLTTTDGEVLEFNTEYTTNKYTLTIKPVDENNKALQVWDEESSKYVDIADVVVQDVLFNSNYEYMADSVKGYTPTSEKFTYTMDTEGKTVYATYTTKTYTLKGKVASTWGSEPTPFTDNSGFKISDGVNNIQTPENGEFTFGTYKYLAETSLSSSKTGYSTITENIKFTTDADVDITFANTANSYTVKYEGNGATSGTMSPQTMYYDVSAALTENAFTKTNYEFGNWLSSKESKTYADKVSVKNLCTGTAGDTEITLTAQWIPKEGSLTISIVPVDGQADWGHADPNKVFATSGSTTAAYNTDTKKLVISDSSTAKTTNVSAVPATDTEGQYTYSFVEYTDIPEGTISGESITIHVKFKQEISKYDVTVSANTDGYGKVKLGASEETSQTVNVLYGSTWAVDENNNLVITTPENEKITLIAVPSAQTAQYQYGFSGWDPTSGTIKKNWSITANFTRELCEYNVSGTVSVSTGEEFANGISVTCNCPTSVTATTDEDGYFRMEGVPYDATGYTFTLSKGANSGYIDYTSEKIAITGDKTDCDFVNKLEPITYSIKYNANIEGSSGTMEASNATYDTACTLTPNAFTHPNYTFVGWNTQDDGKGTPFEDEDDVLNLTTQNGGEVTLYAQWEKNKASATFNEQTHTLNLYYDIIDRSNNGEDTYLGIVPDDYTQISSIPWLNIRENIYEVNLDETVKNWTPTNTTYLFYGMEYVTELDLTYLNTSESINMYYMFAGCSHLQTIYVGEHPLFSTKSVASGNGNDMFKDDVKLVGGSGTTYSADKKSYTYACVDDPENGKPGYFTGSSLDKTKTRFALIYDSESAGYPVLDIPDDDVVFEEVQETSQTHTFQVSMNHPFRNRIVWEELSCWYIGSGASFKKFDPGMPITIGVSTKDYKCNTLVVHAMWQPPYIYGINYISDIVSDVDNMPESYSYKELVKTESDEIVSPKVPTALGYKFLYWRDNAGNKYYPDAPEEERTIHEVAGQGVANLTAEWENEPFQKVVYTFFKEGTLTFYYGSYQDAKALKSDSRGEKIGQQVLPYYNEDEEQTIEEKLPWYSIKGKITAVKFDDSFATYEPEDGFSMSYWFKDMTGLFDINLANINTNKLDSCTSLFENCYNLNSIYDSASSPFVAPETPKTLNMFKNCYQLKASVDDKVVSEYDPAHTDGTYAKIVKADDTAGYFTNGDAPEPEKKYSYKILFSTDNADNVEDMPSSAVVPSDDSPFNYPLSWENLNVKGDPHMKSGDLNFWGWRDESTGKYYYAGDQKTGFDIVELNASLQTINLKAVWGQGEDMRAKAYKIVTPVKTENGDTDENMVVVGITYENARATIGVEGAEYLGEVPSCATSPEDIPWHDIASTINVIGIVDKSFLDFKVQNISWWFSGLGKSCKQLKSLDYIKFAKDEENPNEELSIAHAFENSDLTYLQKGMSALQTNSVTDFSYAFSGSRSDGEFRISDFDISSATNFEGMFKNSYFNEINLAAEYNEWNTSHVTNMNYMFENSAQLKTIWVDGGWSVAGAQAYINDENMFADCIKLVGANGTCFDENYVGSSRAIPDRVYSTQSMLLFQDNAAGPTETKTQKGYLSYKDPEGSDIVRLKYKYVDSDGKEQTYPFSQQITMDQEEDPVEGTSNSYWYATVQGSDNPSFIPEDTYVDPTNLEVIGWNLDKKNKDSWDYTSGSVINLADNYHWGYYDPDLNQRCIDLWAYFSEKPVAHAVWQSATGALGFLYYPEKMIPKVLDSFSLKYGPVTDLGQITETQTKAEDLPWHQYRSLVNRIYFDDSMGSYMPKNLSYFFSDMPRLTDVDLSLLNTSIVTNVSNMFYNDRHLRTIAVRSNWSLSFITPATGKDMFTNCNKLIGLYSGDSWGDEFTYDSTCTNYQYAKMNGVNNFQGYFSRTINVFEKLNCRANDLNLARIAVLYDDNNLGTPPEDTILWEQMGSEATKKVPLQAYEVPYGYTFTGWRDVITGKIYNASEVTEVELTIADTTRQFIPDCKYEAADNRAYAILDYQIRLSDNEAELVGNIVHIYFDNKDYKEHTAVDSTGQVDYTKMTYDPNTGLYTCGVQYLGEFDPNYKVEDYHGVPMPHVPWIYNEATKSIQTHLLNSVTGFNFDSSCRYNETTETGLKMENLEAFFAYMPNIESLDLTNLDMSHATSMAYMFVQSPQAAGEIEVGNDASINVPNSSNNKFPIEVGNASKLTQFPKGFEFRINMGENTIVPNPHIDPIEPTVESANSKLSKITFPVNVFPQKPTYEEVTAPSSVRCMFAGCTSLKEINMANWNLNNVSDFQQMFALCISLNSVVWPDNFKPSNGQIYNTLAEMAIQLGFADELVGVNFYGMFFGCVSINSINFNTTSFSITKDDNYVVDMSIMFAGCVCLSNISFPYEFNCFPYSLALTFYGCFSIQKLDLTNIDTHKTYMLIRCFSECDTLETILVNSELWDLSHITPEYGSMLGSEVFLDCYSLKGGYSGEDYGPTTYNSEKTDYTYACIDQGDLSEHPGYLTGAERTPTGSASNSFNVLFKKGSLYYNEQQTVFDIPWTEESWPADIHETATSGSYTFKLPEDAPVMVVDENEHRLGNFNCYYKYNTLEIAKILIAQYDLSYFFKQYGITFDLDVNPTIMHPGDEITLSAESPFIWLEADASFNKGFYLSYYGGAYPNADMPDPEIYVSGDSEHTFTISNQIPKSGNQSFLYYQDTEGNIYNPGDEFTIERVSSSSVEIRELTAVWTRNEYATLNSGVLTVVPGSVDASDTQNLPEGFIGNVPSVAFPRSIYLLDSLDPGSSIIMPSPISGNNDIYKSYPWYKYRSSITKIKFDNAFATTAHQKTMSDYSNYFRGLNVVTQVDLTYFVVSENVSNLELNLNNMFYGCTSLKTVYLYGRDKLWTDETNINNIWIRCSGMFGLCNALVGGNGTRYTVLNMWNDPGFDPINYLSVDSDDYIGLFTAGNIPIPEEGQTEYFCQFDAGEASGELIVGFPDSFSEITDQSEFRYYLPDEKIISNTYGKLLKWYVKNEITGSCTTYDPGREIVLTSTNPIIHLYAWWDSETIYSINYSNYSISLGGDNPNLPEEQIEYDSNNIPHVMYVTNKIPTWNHHTFKNWIDNSGNVYLPGDPIRLYPNDSNVDNPRNITLFANWDEDPCYKLDVVQQGPSDWWGDFQIWSGEIKQYTTAEEYDLKIPEDIYALCSGYKVDEWKVKRTGLPDLTVKPGDTVHMTKDVSSGTITPIWQIDPRIAYCVMDYEKWTVDVYFDENFREGDKNYIRIDGYYGESAPWRMYNNDINTITFDSSMKDYKWQSFAYMFQYMYKLEHINGLENLSSNSEPNNSINAYQMFYECSNLQEINFGSSNSTIYIGYCERLFQNCSSVMRIDINRLNFNYCYGCYGVFNYCGKLQTIYASNELTRGLRDGGYETTMFDNCTALVGGNGKRYVDGYDSWGRMACVPYWDEEWNWHEGYFTEGFIPTYKYNYRVEYYTNSDLKETINADMYAGFDDSFSKFTDDESCSYTIPNQELVYRRDKTLVFNYWSDENGTHYNRGQQITLDSSNRVIKLYPVWKDEHAQVTDRAFYGFNETTGTVTLYGSQEVLDKSDDVNWTKKYGTDWKSEEGHVAKPWEVETGLKDVIRKIKTDESLETYRFMPICLDEFCINMYNLTYIDLTYLNTCCVQSMRRAFIDNEKLTQIDLGKNFVTPKYLKDCYDAFSYNRALTTIYTEYDFSKVIQEQEMGMFYDDYSLVGGQGSTLQQNGPISKYARIDQGEDAPGFFTKSSKHPEHPENFSISVNYNISDEYRTVMPTGYEKYAWNLKITGAPDSQLVFVNENEGQINVDTSHIPQTNNFDFIEWVDENGDPVGDTLTYSVSKGITSFNLYPKFELHTNDDPLSYATISYNADDWAEVTLYYDNQYDTRENVLKDELGHVALVHDASRRIGSGKRINDDAVYVPWKDHAQKVVSVDIDSSFANCKLGSLDCLFQGLTYCSAIKLQDNGSPLINFANISSMNSTFEGCSALPYINFSNYDLSNMRISGLEGTFNNCMNLRKIYFDSQDKCPKQAQEVYVSCFYNCFGLEGGHNTKYKDLWERSQRGEKIEPESVIYAQIDGGEADPGYFTLSSEKPANVTYPYLIHYNSIYEEHGEDWWSSEEVYNCPDDFYGISETSSTTATISTQVPSRTCGKPFNGWKNDIDELSIYTPGEQLTLNFSTTPLLLNLSSTWNNDVPWAYKQTNGDGSVNVLVGYQLDEAALQQEGYQRYDRSISDKPWLDDTNKIVLFTIDPSMEEVGISSGSSFFAGFGSGGFNYNSVSIVGLEYFNKTLTTTNVDRMFAGADLSKFTQQTLEDINNKLDVSSASSFNETFTKAIGPKCLDLSKWDVSKANHFNNMFYYYSVNENVKWDESILDVSNWSIFYNSSSGSSVNNIFADMFYGTDVATINMSHWSFSDNIPKTEQRYYDRMFYSCTALTIYANNQDNYILPDYMVEKYDGSLENLSNIKGGNGYSYQGGSYQFLRVDERKASREERPGYFTYPADGQPGIKIEYWSSDGSKCLSSDFIQVADKNQAFDVQGYGNNAFDVYDEEGKVIDSSKYGWSTQPGSEDAEFTKQQPVFVSQLTTVDNVARLYFAYKQVPFAEYDNPSFTLTLKYGTPTEKSIGTIPDSIESPDSLPWASYRGDLSTIIVDSSFAYYQPTSMKLWFYGMKSVQTFKGAENIDFYRVQQFDHAFCQCNITKGWSDFFDKLNAFMSNDNYVTNVYCMFSDAQLSAHLALPNWKLTYAESGQDMFNSIHCPDEQSYTLNVDGWKWESAQDLARTFENSNIKLSINNWDFSKCINLTIEGFFKNSTALDETVGEQVSKWNVENVYCFYEMFSYEGFKNPVPLPKTLDFSGWEVKNRASKELMLERMFCNCLIFNENKISSMDLYGSYTRVCGMFNRADLSNISYNHFDNFLSNDGVNHHVESTRECQYMFEDAYMPKDGFLSLRNWNMCADGNLEGMFKNSKGLVKLDITGWANICFEKQQKGKTMYVGVQNAAEMFYGCKTLRTVYSNITKWVPGLYSWNMFYGCSGLVGGNGTDFDSGWTDVSYALPDAVNNPGYFTYNDPNTDFYSIKYYSSDGKLFDEFVQQVKDPVATIGGNTLGFLPERGQKGWTTEMGTEAQYYNGETYEFGDSHELILYATSQGVAGNEFYAINNTKEGSLTFYFGVVPKAGDNEVVYSGYGTEDWPVVPSSVSQLPWGLTANNINTASFDQSCSASELKITSMSYWFANMPGLSSVDFTYVNTSNLTSTAQMFANTDKLPNKALTSLDLSKWNTSKISDMNHMFAYCVGLQTITVGKGWTFGTKNATEENSKAYFQEVFINCEQLTGGNGTRYNEMKDGTQTQGWRAVIDYMDMGGTPTDGYLTPHPDEYKTVQVQYFNKTTKPVFTQTLLLDEGKMSMYYVFRCCGQMFGDSTTPTLVPEIPKGYSDKAYCVGWTTDEKGDKAEYSALQWYYIDNGKSLNLYAIWVEPQEK